MTFAKDVWDTLSRIDVSEHIEKKKNLSYLSWAWAWGELMSNYPESYYDIKKPIVYENGTCEVRVSLVVASGGKKFKRTMWLPVMDHRNQAIVNPNSRDVSDARMRCLVKCIAMFGLGHYIYAGEDLPAKEVINPHKDYAGDGSGLQPADTEQLDMMTNLYQQEDDLGLWCMKEKLGVEVWGTLRGALGGRMGKGNKTKGMLKLNEFMDSAENKVVAYTQEMKKFIENDDARGIEELRQLQPEIKKEIAKHLTPEETLTLSGNIVCPDATVRLIEK